MEYESFDVRKYPTLSVKKGYREWAESYEDSVENLMDIRLLERITSIEWDQINSAIDLACGTGRIGVWLKKQGTKSIDGIDFTSEMLKKAEEKGVYNELIHGDILDTHLKANAYDLSIEVLADEHVSDLHVFYSEAARITKEGGFFVMIGRKPEVASAKAEPIPQVAQR